MLNISPWSLTIHAKLFPLDPTPQPLIDAVVEELITDVDADVDASTLHPAEHGVLDGGSGNPDGADPTTALDVPGSQDSPNSPDTSDTPESLDSSDQDDAAVVMGETNVRAGLRVSG